MPYKCVFGCPPKIRGRLHRFPPPIRNPEQYYAWVAIVTGENDYKNFEYSKYRVCDRHFTESDHTCTARLHSAAVPTLYLFGEEPPENSDHTYSGKKHAAPASPTSYVCSKESQAEAKIDTSYNNNSEDYDLVECEEITKTSESPIKSVEDKLYCVTSTITEDIQSIKDDIILVEDEGDAVENCMESIKECTSCAEDEKTCVKPNSTPSKGVDVITEDIQINKHIMDDFQDFHLCERTGIIKKSENTTRPTGTIDCVTSSITEDIESIEDDVILIEDGDSPKHNKIHTKLNSAHNKINDLSFVPKNVAVAKHFIIINGNVCPTEIHVSSVNDSGKGTSNRKEKNTCANCNDRPVFLYDDETSIKIEIANVLKFYHRKGKTAKEVIKEIEDTYGPNRLTLHEAECWFREFNLGNSDILNVLFSGGPVYE